MPPPGTNLGSCRDRDYCTILMPDVLVARKARIVHVLDWVVTVWRANAFQLTLVDAINRHLLENGMGRCESSYAQKYGEGLHNRSVSGGCVEVRLLVHTFIGQI